MGLFQKACETYETLVSLPEEKRGRTQLLSISHMYQNAYIEITLKSDGTFFKAEKVEDDDSQTVIPVFLDSSIRTGQPERAHPFEDQLRYISDYPVNGSDKKIEEKKTRYLAYTERLSGWANSENSHPMVKVVLAYILGGTILHDLEASGLIKLDENGAPDKDESFIRWRVLGFGNSDKCWQNKELLDSFTKYFLEEYRPKPSKSKSKTKKKDKMKESEEEEGAEEEEEQMAPDLCMVTGDICNIAANHPKGIVIAPKKYGAKLISANDSSGFTYRGRFTEARQAATVGYIASQKAHIALSWLTREQGVVVGGRTFLCWDPRGVKVPSPMGASESDTPKVKMSDYRSDLYAEIMGYRESIPKSDTIVMTAFDAATTGRLSVTYYSEQPAFDMLDNLQSWRESFCFYFGKFGIQSPSLQRVAERAFGTEKGDFISLDEKSLRQQVQRLLPCVTERARLPFDLVRALAERASTPQAYKLNNRIGLLSTACAAIRKYHNDILQREEYGMELDTEKNDVSYQYGRLLAVFEKVERDTYGKDENREPNAIRLQSVFAKRPLYAARLIHEALEPYFARLAPRSRAYYKKMIGEIMAHIGTDPMTTGLGDTYLIGYYLQRNELYKSRKNKDTDGAEAEFDENETEEI